MDVKTVPSGDFKEHSSRDPFPVQEFLFLFIEQPLMLLFPRSALFRLFLLLFPAFLFLPPFVCLSFIVFFLRYFISFFFKIRCHIIIIAKVIQHIKKIT